MSESILQVELNASYRGKQILSSVSFDLQRGEMLGLVGTSGAGKSTLVLALLGLLQWRGGSASGRVLFQGRNLLDLPERELRKLRGRHIAMVPQSPLSALNSVVSLQTHFREAWLAHERPSSGRLRARVEQLMDEVDLPHTDEFMRRRPGQISVGQAQRVLIALALLHRPAVIIADEPTSALDPVTQMQVVSLLRHVARTQGTTILYISHDLVSVLQLSDRISVLHNGRIVETLPTHLLSKSTQEATMSLLATLPLPVDVMMRYRPSNGLASQDCISDENFSLQTT